MCGLSNPGQPPEHIYSCDTGLPGHGYAETFACLSSNHSLTRTLHPIS